MTYSIQSLLKSLSAIALFISSLSLGGCATPIEVPLYTVSASNIDRITQTRATGISLATFEEPPAFDTSCRGLKTLSFPNDRSAAKYIQGALEAELRASLALATTSSPSRITLYGRLDSVKFSSSKSITMGEWDIQLSLRSSNGKSMSVREVFEFDSGFEATEVCMSTANAFVGATQNLLGKLVIDPDFSSLLK